MIMRAAAKAGKAMSKNPNVQYAAFKTKATLNDARDLAKYGAFKAKATLKDARDLAKYGAFKVRASLKRK